MMMCILTTDENEFKNYNQFLYGNAFKLERTVQVTRPG